MHKLAGWFSTLTEDIQTVFTKDPAARSVVEVISCYPGLHRVYKMDGVWPGRWDIRFETIANG